ncbi:hypothetical protein AeRB84_004179 [Aphanomyces euteiches]|nr:hypothetical protein AeRB84_004179 [Aphanomyces euteiches]
MEIATTTNSAWTAIGQQLALQWQAISSSPYFVTTCIKNKPTNSNQTALLFLAGYDGFPQCQPSNGPEEIAGVAMLETTVRDEFQDGAYMLTVFADKTMVESLLHVNSDGSTDLLIAKINQTLIATNGSVTIDTVGINGVKSTVPLGEFFKVSTYSYPVVLDITNQANITRLDGWHVGQKSKKAVVMTWDHGHHVENRHLLVTFQVVFLGMGSWLISGDLYLTVRGLQGLLAKKPVMTFDLAAGLERRKLVVLFWLSSLFVNLVYPDVVWMSHGLTAAPIWALIVLLLGAYYLCWFILSLGFLTCIPSPFVYVVPMSASFMNHAVYAILEVVYFIQLPVVLDHYRHAPLALALNVSGNLCSSGAYANHGRMESAHSLLFPSGLVVMASCTFLAMTIAMARLKWTHGTYLLNLDWTTSNKFISHCGRPHWISTLPLHRARMIKIGHKLYCKPSCQAALGIATIDAQRGQVNDCGSIAIHPKKLHGASDDDNELTLVSVYSLPLILYSIHTWVPQMLRPTIFGTVKRYTFSPQPTSRIENRKFAHHRGICAN